MSGIGIRGYLLAALLAVAAIGIAVTGTLSIEQVVAAHTGDPRIIDDADILWAIGLWTKGEEVPGTGGQVIDDDTILDLIELWISGERVRAVALKEGRSITVTVRAEGLTLNYSRELYWNEGRFDQEYEEFSQDKARYLTGSAEGLLQDWSQYGIGVTDWAISFRVEYEETGKSSYSSLLRCEIHDAISKSGNRYSARFGWLLRPLGLDFIDDNFEETKDGLSWEGEINSVPTSIMVKLPPRDTIYEAWGQPNGHCHAHAWWIEIEED